MNSESRVVAVQERRELAPLTAMALLERREMVQRVIEEVMIEDVHYGVIPGTKTISLLKEGAEVLLSTFNIAVEPVITDQCTQTEVRFQVECRGIHMGTQMYVGSGIGVCSSNEEKYRWRRARSEAEYEAADLTHRRIKYGATWTDKQVRQSPWDVFHTIMSMANKRGMVALAKTALAASECLKRSKLKRPPPPQDDGRPPAGNHTSTPAANARRQAEPPVKTAGTAPSATKAQDKPRPATPPVAETAAPGPTLITALQAQTISEKIDHAGIPDNAFFARFELGSIEDLDAARLEAAHAWIKANSP